MRMPKRGNCRAAPYASIAWPLLSLAGGPVLARGVDFVAILVFGADEKTGKGCGGGFVDHGLNLPDHSSFANAGIRERRAPVAGIEEKIIFAVTSQRIGGSLQRSLRIQLQQKAPILHRQCRRAFLTKVYARPAVVSGRNQKTLRRPAIENHVKRSRTEKNSGDKQRKAKNCAQHQKCFVHAKLFRDLLRSATL